MVSWSCSSGAWILERSSSFTGRCKEEGNWTWTCCLILLLEMEGVEIQAGQPGSDIVLQGRHNAFSQVRGRDKGNRVCCLGNGIKPKKYWSEESSTNPTTDPNAEVLNLRQQLENSVAEHQAAMQQISDLEALRAHDELGTANTAYQAALIRIAELEAELRKYKTVTPSTDAEIRNSPRMEDLGAHRYNPGNSGACFFEYKGMGWSFLFFMPSGVFLSYVPNFP